MGRRKEYLNPGSASSIPYSTKTYLQRSARRAQESRVPQQATNVTQPHSSVFPGHAEASIPTPHSDAQRAQLPAQTQPVEDAETTAEGYLYAVSADEVSTSSGPPIDQDLPEVPQEDSSFSADDLLALTVNFVLEFGLPWKGVEALQRFIMHVLARHDIPATKYRFKKSVGAEIKAARFHFYCGNCMKLLVETTGDLAERNAVRGTCSVCGRRYSGQQMLQDGHFFLTLPIVKLLSSLLSGHDVAGALNERLESIQQSLSVDKNGMADIIDGSLYRELRHKLASKNDLTLTINTDGSPVFKSSKFSVWPIQMTVNELPAHIRQKNVLVSALWYGQKHPDMTLLLNTFVEQMDSLSTNGITWMAGNETVHSKVYCFSCCADAPARAAMQHLTQFNGYYGCGWCLNPGTSVEGTIKYLVNTVVPDRTAEDTKTTMIEVARTGQPVQGVKGLTPLINLPHFNIIWGFTPDYMHCVLLGVSRQLTENWLSDVGEQHYIGAPETVAAIDERLCAIKPHRCVPRLPRSILLRKYWKASE
ncbi:uncharacterized protein LOC144101989 [Amblyomma americanum]